MFSVPSLPDYAYSALSSLSVPEAACPAPYHFSAVAVFVCLGFENCGEHK